MANQPYTEKLARWLFDRDWYETEAEKGFRELFPADKPDIAEQYAEEFEIFFNQWLTYDRPTSLHGKTPLQLFIEDRVRKNPVERSIYEGFGRGWLGAFQVQKVRFLESLSLRDLVTDTVYEVSERSGTMGTEIGDVIFARVLPYGKGHILAAGYGKFAKEDAESMVYTCNRLRPTKHLQPLTAHDMIALLFVSAPNVAMKRWKALSALDDFLKLKHSAARSATEIAEEFQRLRRPDSLIQGLLKDASLASQHDAQQFLALLMDVWNAFCAKPQECGVGAGPLEHTLVNDMLHALHTQNKRQQFEDAETAKRSGEQQRERYLHAPQRELDGKTPWEAILEERARLGNSDTSFGYDLTVYGVGDQLLDTIRDFLTRAAAAFKKQQFGRALGLYKRLIALDDREVPEIWRIYGNAGACAFQRHDLDLAEHYLKKALALNPRYALGKRNLKRLLTFKKELKGYRGPGGEDRVFRRMVNTTKKR